MTLTPELLLQLAKAGAHVTVSADGSFEVIGRSTADKRAERNRRYYESKRLKTSENVLEDAETSGLTELAEPPLSPSSQVSPTPPSSPSPPKPPLPGISAEPQPDGQLGKKPRTRNPKPKAESTADPRHSEFVQAFAECWAEANDGDRYPVTPRDGQNLKDFLTRCDKPVDELMRGVRWCWQVLAQDGQHAAGCVKGSTTIAGFVSNYGALVPYSKAYKQEKQRR